MGVGGCSCVENKMAGGEVRGLSSGRIVYLDIDIPKGHTRKSAEKAGTKFSAKLRSCPGVYDFGR